MNKNNYLKILYYSELSFSQSKTVYHIIIISKEVSLTGPVGGIMVFFL